MSTDIGAAEAEVLGALARPEVRSDGRDRRALAARVATRVGSAFVSIAAILGGWEFFLKAFHVKHFIGKGPLDVWRYLVTSSAAGANRMLMYHESLTTVRDASLGLVAGTAAAVLASVAFTLWSPVERTVMPVAFVLRSVPLVAMTPLIVLIFGRDIGATTVIAGIVTFFPTLVNVSLALRWSSQDSMDLLRALGASRLTTLRKVQLPNALPALFASLRIAGPLALVGAMLAEWLATGDGLGYRILQAGAVSDYSGLWAAVALVTFYSLTLYKSAAAMERLVLARFGASRA